MQIVKHNTLTWEVLLHAGGRKVRTVCMMLLFLLTAWSMADDGRLQGRLTIFHAGSLAMPIKKIARQFEERHPGVQVLRETAGSVECARKVAELNQSCDVLASADYQVIDKLLIPDHTLWSIRFARNEMCLVYSDRSRRADVIDADNWFDILQDSSVSFGRSDPNLDPCGYRTVMTMKLAEKHYGQPGLAATLLAKDNRFIRPKETELLALLELGAIDYAFLYRSVGQQHGLRCLVLPDEINLKNPALTDLYRSVSVKIRGATRGEFLNVPGEPMIYGITIPRNAANPDLAVEFVRFLLEADGGLAILSDHGQPPLLPVPATGYSQIPEALKQFASP